MCETQFEEILPAEPEVLDIPQEEAFQEESIQEEPWMPAEPTPRKKRWVPYVILAAIFVVGLVFYLVTLGFVTDKKVSDPQLPWFSIDNGTLYFDGSKYTGGSTLLVPKTVAGQTVTALSDNCFAGANTFIMINLPDTLEIIGSQAFADCTKLRGVFIPGSVTRIGSSAFWGCTKLESVCIPAEVTFIGTGAFYNCPKLIHIFYGGSMEDWKLLYPEYIAPKTSVYASDGTLTQATTP